MLNIFKNDLYFVKVMLISHPGLMAIRRKLSGLMSDGSIDEATETQPLTKTIQLLVGMSLFP